MFGAEHSLSYHRSFGLSSTFFDFFQNLFSYPARRSLPLGSLDILPHLPCFVKYFFRFFSKSFSYSTAVAPFARELDYFTTASCFCQALFSLSTKLFSKALERTRLSATARLIYHTPAPLSIPFCKKFETSPRFAIGAFYGLSSSSSIISSASSAA